MAQRKYTRAAKVALDRADAIDRMNAERERRCNALSDDCESTCGLPLDDDRECPDHGPVIGGGRIE